MLFKTAISITIALFFTLTTAAQDQEVKVGSFKITSTSSEILGDELASSFEKVLGKNDELAWHVYVPKNYDPSKPAGILLFQTYRQLREPIGWKSAMDEKNLIYINVFATRGLTHRKEMLLSVMGLPLLQKYYKINTDRVYATAHLGCNVVGSTANVYPNIIKGAIYVNCIPSTWEKNLPERIDLMRENRYVFVQGKNSNTRSAARREERRYNKNGILNTKFTNAARMGAGDNLNRRELLRAIKYLDDTN